MGVTLGTGVFCVFWLLWGGEASQQVLGGVSWLGEEFGNTAPVQWDEGRTGKAAVHADRQELALLSSI